jgi:hypothetical protein
MELFSNTFKQWLQILINRPQLIIIATIPFRPMKFIDALRTQHDHRLITVSIEQEYSIDFSFDEYSFFSSSCSFQWPLDNT